MRQLSRLLFPRSIAFIGGRECEIAIRKTRQLGFEGQIWPVNPRRAEVAGIAAVASVADLPEAPDAAFIAVRRRPTIGIMADLARLGAGGAVVFASGFSETGDVHLQQGLMEAAAGMPFLGPNCNGYVNFMCKAVLWPDDYGGGPCQRGVAIVAQSGNIAVNLTMLRRALPVAGVFALGNQADVDIAQMVEALAADDRVTAIGLHIEGLRDVQAFARAVEGARELRKPVVALKTGRSAAGARITLGHTSSLSGEDALYGALFRHLGVAQVASITAFAETLKFLHVGGPARGTRLVSMSCSGGEAALVADIAEGRGVDFPPFDVAGKARVEATLNELVRVGNPLDYQTFIWGDEDKLVATFSAVLAGNFDIGMLILDVPTVPGADPASWRVTAEAFRRAALATGTRAAVVATLPECLPEDLADQFSAAGIAPMAGLDDALTAFEQAAAIGRIWSEPSSALLWPGPTSAFEARQLTEYAAKRLLAAAGLPVPEGRISTPANAPTVARSLGFPVVLKVSDEALAHKTEVGGVALDLADEAEVERAAARLGALASRLLVERMAQNAVCELIVGVKADPQFGLALVIGAGGILAELVQDTTTLLLPTTRAAVEAALSGLRVSRLIDGFRGRSGDRPAVIEAILALARFAESRAGEIVELEVNPLLVLPHGRGAVAVDALVRLVPTPNGSN